MSDPSRALARLVWLPWLVVLPLVVALTIFTLKVNRGWKAKQSCHDRLRQLHTALVTYHNLNGQLPQLDFYPQNPATDEGSLLVALEKYSVPPQCYVCPHTPASIREEQGLTYLWNVDLNGAVLQNVPPDTWMLIEISALSPAIKAPHFGTYSILRRDGTITSSRTVPEDIRPVSNL